MTLFQVSGTCILQTISVRYFGAPCFLTTRARDGEITDIIWKSLFIVLLIKMYGADSILLQDYSQFPDQFS